MPPRLPTARLEMSGTLKDHPSHYALRKDEPRPKTPLGIAPKDLVPELVPFWNEIRRMLNCMPGVAVYTDRFTVERLCRLAFKMRNDTMSVAEGAQMLSYLGKLGLTPVDRSRIQVEAQQAKAHDDWSFKQLHPKSAPVRDKGTKWEDPSVPVGQTGDATLPN